MNEAEFDRFITYYYQSGSPNKAPEALQYLINSEMLQVAMAQEGTYHLITYLFSRIVQDHSEVLRQYEALFDEASHEGRLFIMRILELGGDEKTRDFMASRLNLKEFESEQRELDRILASPTRSVNPLHNPISGCPDLDLLWGEFLATGDTNAVRRIIQVLEWPDIVRENLQAWLESKPRFRLLGWSKVQRSSALGRLRDIAGIECDIGQNYILTVEDLDCLCVLEELQISQERFQKIRKALPFQLSADELNDLFVKAAAKWSLGSNAIQHLPVLKTCEEELINRVGRSKLALLEIVARTYLFQNDETAAAERITEYVRLNPVGVRIFSKAHSTSNGGMVFSLRPKGSKK